MTVGRRGTSVKTRLEARGNFTVALARGDFALGVAMIRYMTNMMRKPGTFLVSLLMVSLILFGVWELLHVVKR